MLEVGRGTQGLGTKVLLQPLAHGITDRSAGLAIDLFAVVVDPAVHGRFRFLVIRIRRCDAGPSHGDGELFRGTRRQRAFLAVNETCSTDRTPKKAPAQRAGAF